MYKVLKNRTSNSGGMGMKGKCIAAVFICFLFATAALAQTPQITNGLTYLSSTQSPDGSWGVAETNTDNLPTTCAALEALRSLGQTSSPAYYNAVLWLQSQELETTDYYSERIRALASAETDIDSVLSYLDELLYAWGGYEDFDANNLDTKCLGDVVSQIA